MCIYKWYNTIMHYAQCAMCKWVEVECMNESLCGLVWSYSSSNRSRIVEVFSRRLAVYSINWCFNNKSSGSQIVFNLAICYFYSNRLKRLSEIRLFSHQCTPSICSTHLKIWRFVFYFLNLFPRKVTFLPEDCRFVQLFLPEGFAKLQERRKRGKIKNSKNECGLLG